MHDCGMGIYLYWHTLPVSNQLRKPGCDMWSQYQIICWTQNLNLHPGTLEGPHLSVSPSTCWHIELSILGLLRSSISIHLRIFLTTRSCSMKFFQLKITLGLALDKIWSLLAQPQKNTDVHKGMFLWDSFPRQTCRNHLRRKQGCKLIDQI